MDIEGASGLFVVDHYSGKVHKLSAVESDAVEAGRVMMAIKDQMRVNLPSIPYDQISEVIKAERGVAESARKSVEEGKDKEE